MTLHLNIASPHAIILRTLAPHPPSSLRTSQTFPTQRWGAICMLANGGELGSPSSTARSMSSSGVRPQRVHLLRGHQQWARGYDHFVDRHRAGVFSGTASGAGEHPTEPTGEVMGPHEKLRLVRLIAGTEREARSSRLRPPSRSHVADQRRQAHGSDRHHYAMSPTNATASEDKAAHESRRPTD